MSDYQENYNRDYTGKQKASIKKKNKAMRKKRKKIIAMFILMLPFLTPFSLIAMIRFLPFDNLRNVIVSSLTTSLNHGSFAKLFASQSYINNLTTQNRWGLKEGSSSTGHLNIAHLHDKTISLVGVNGGSFQGKMLIINDPTSISVGLSRYLPDHGEVTSSIARKENALAAINAGGFNGENWGGLGGKPLGVIIKNGKFMYKPPYYKEYTDVVGFTWKGELIVGRQRIDNLLNMGVKEAVCFGPALIVEGQLMIKQGDGGMGIAPRTVIGQTRDGKVLMLVVDGRQIGSQGAYLKDVMNIMKDYGAVNAANLDGGASTTMYVQGRVINNPSDILGERAVPDVFLVK